MPAFVRIGAVGIALLAVGCSDAVDVEDVPLGADVQVTRDDGGLIEGRLTERDAESVTVAVGTATKSVPVERIADVRVVTEEMTAPEPPPMARFRELTVPSGTPFTIEVQTPIDTGRDRAGKVVEATLVEPVTIDAIDVLPSGSALQGRIAGVEAAGKVKGRAMLALAFDRITAHGEIYPIDARFEVVAPATREEDVKTIGLPAAGGAIAGAILGGKKGAAIGAAIGGGAGTAAVLLTPGEEVTIGEGARISVALDRPLDVKVPIRD